MCINSIRNTGFGKRVRFAYLAEKQTKNAPTGQATAMALKFKWWEEST